MECKVCGASLPSDVLFCGYCGAPLRKADDAVTVGSAYTARERMTDDGHAPVTIPPPVKPSRATARPAPLPPIPAPYAPPAPDEIALTPASPPMGSDVTAPIPPDNDWRLDSDTPLPPWAPVSGSGADEAFDADWFSEPEAPRRVYTPPPARKNSGLLIVLSILCLLAFSAVVLLGGAYYDLFDPLGIREVLWVDQETLSTPPAAGDTPSSDVDSTPSASPANVIDRGKPPRDAEESVKALLRASGTIGFSFSESNPKLSNNELLLMAWAGFKNAEPGRRSFTPGAQDGFVVSQLDLDTLLNECLGYTVSNWPSLNSDSFPPGLSKAGDEYLWTDDFSENQFIDIFSWDKQSDGSVQVGFNVLTRGQLYVSFSRKGMAVVKPNDNPTYYSYRLDTLQRTLPSSIAKVTPSASSYLPDVGDNRYTPDMLTDGKLTTAWIEGKQDAGEGETITLKLAEPTPVTGLSIVNGYTKDAKTLKNNSRVKNVMVSCGGELFPWTLEDVDYHEDGDYQSFVFGKSIMTDTISITIESVYVGEKYQDTCISEIELF